MNAKSKKFFFIFLSIFLGFFSPIRFVQAGWVLDLIIGIATTPFFWIFWAVAQIAKYLTELMGSILNWVLGPNFISWSYTNPANNEVIKTGLGVTQGFVNMLLVLVLVYIAVATILRLAGYETKKLLVTFIIVALLVNFAPVLCGLIVDAANIIMNFFVQDLKTDAFGKTMGAKITEIYNFSWEEGAQQSISRLFQLIIFSGILFVLSFILLIFILIFILRYLVIWLLVILSPLAFVAYILPATRKYFEQWWKQFLAWTFIGVTCGFFLYLALLMVSKVPVAMTAPTTGQGGLLDAILPYFVAVIFLGIGVVFGLSTSAMGASTAINFAKTKGKAGAGFATRHALRQTAGRFLSSEKGKKMMEKLRIPTAREGWKEAKTIKGKLLKGGLGLAATTIGARWAVRGIKYAGSRYGAVQEERTEAEKKKIEKQFGNDYERAAITYDSILPLNYHKKIAMARYIAEKKGGKGLDKLSNDNLREAVKLTATYSPDTLSDIVKHKQGLITDEKVGNIVKNTMVGKTPEKQMDDKDVKTLMKLGMTAAQAVKMAAFKKATDALKEKDVENLTDEIKEMPEFHEMTARFKGWSFINKIGVEKGLDWVQKIQNTAQEELGIEEIARSNPSFARAPYTPAGSMFFSPWKRDKGKGAEITKREEINKIIQETTPLVSDDEIEREQKEYLEEERKKRVEKGPPPPSGAPKRGPKRPAPGASKRP